MRLIRTPAIRKTTASKLRAWADQLEPRSTERNRPPEAPLVRLGGRWLPRDEIAGSRDPTDL
jgi:hypothetical protein